MIRNKMTHLGAFESTQIFGTGQDVLRTTHHTEKWREDLDRLLEAGITDLRYPIPWHQIETQPGVFDFSWIDGPLEHIRRNGMRPIADPLHHTSFPEWLEGGFNNPVFGDRYLAFLTRILERYPWIDRYTVFNEPFATTVLCSLMGVWYPYASSNAAFARMSIQVARTICAGSRLIRSRVPSVELVRVDTCEYHHALDRKSEPWANFCNQRRYLLDDLVMGRLSTAHPLWFYLISNGIEAEELRWFQEHAVDVDFFGLDYYAHSEMDWAWDPGMQRVILREPVSSPRGFAAVARDYLKYGKPLMLTETNIRGNISDRVTWLKFMEEQCERLSASGEEVKGFCWFPSIDSTDWDRLCTQCRLSIDPQGIWHLDSSRWQRRSSDLSDWYSALARGSATSEDLPAFRFRPPLDRQLAGYSKLMPHWKNWISVDEIAA